jgi:hypothetical protein
MLLSDRLYEEAACGPIGMRGQSQVGEGTADFADYADLGIDSSAKSVKSAVPFTSEKNVLAIALIGMMGGSSDG